MNSGKTLFAQLMEFVPWTSFSRIVANYSGDARAMTLPCAAGVRGRLFKGAAVQAHLTLDKAQSPPALYLDQKSPNDLAQLSDPSALFSAHADRLLILDEVQRMLGLFAVDRKSVV